MVEHSPAMRASEAGLIHAAMAGLNPPYKGKRRASIGGAREGVNFHTPHLTIACQVARWHISSPLAQKRVGG
jgi:hypothetical protein